MDHEGLLLMRKLIRKNFIFTLLFYLFLIRVILDMFIRVTNPPPHPSLYTLFFSYTLITPPLSEV